ncbi:NUDIX hydrolase [Robiginitalea aurantiaca]|uniref:NUDIX domain-containing protein n=1 Tax=Robiginitalea aurantiaca TaxID=3056915 RepID=A0ABT7WC79_9FLAO|nr:NUDIX domain-containing protein [Robiginitalea aurantiaca]MDM9630525.1 NUDIX domain-containing protein [Robiginitalea aurantiaca]
MDEYVEIWDKTGKPTGDKAFKSEVHRRGWFHPTVHVWFYTRQNQVLLQKRADTKDTFPGLWDVSVAGHIHAGETPMEAVLREVEEEIGIRILPEDLNFMGRFLSEQAHPGGILDREFQYVYLTELKVPLQALKADPKEVAALELCSLLRLAEEVWGMADVGKYVPHSKPYYSAVLKALKSRP